MKKHLNNPWVSGTLALLAVLLVANSVMDSSTPSPSYSVEDTVDEYEQDENEETAFSDPIGAVFDASSIKELAAQSSPRNIFERQLEKPEPSEEIEEVALAETTIKVKGIWIQNNLRYVIIDDQTLKPGQSIERVRVLSIEEQGVWVTSNDEQHFIEPGQSWTYRYPKAKDKSPN
ncbi:hypothetical protein [Pelagicoccus sp. SDUM812002]|uniref:hypothetical protein n=1 Tax=Pelagicoccus sp. SDUM812002 TaxID=3041266 RepID=UPI00280C9D73|nr:hypothetical protein [Pelagicoccus sp. SDUM812002]MDQ8186472.1 hypothetical protein [Pelagicoccus sp. SDUM812002]